MKAKKIQWTREKYSLTGRISSIRCCYVCYSLVKRGIYELRLSFENVILEFKNEEKAKEAAQSRMDDFVSLIGCERDE